MTKAAGLRCLKKIGVGVSAGFAILFSGRPNAHGAGILMGQPVELALEIGLGPPAPEAEVGASLANCENRREYPPHVISMRQRSSIGGTTHEGGMYLVTKDGKPIHEWVCDALARSLGIVRRQALTDGVGIEVLLQRAETLWDSGMFKQKYYSEIEAKVRIGKKGSEEAVSKTFTGKGDSSGHVMNAEVGAAMASALKDLVGQAVPSLRSQLDTIVPSQAEGNSEDADLSELEHEDSLEVPRRIAVLVPRKVFKKSDRDVADVLKALEQHGYASELKLKSSKSKGPATIVYAKEHYAKFGSALASSVGGKVARKKLESDYRYDIVIKIGVGR